jgi:hypothetical protein
MIVWTSYHLAPKFKAKSGFLLEKARHNPQSGKLTKANKSNNYGSFHGYKLTVILAISQKFARLYERLTMKVVNLS